MKALDVILNLVTIAAVTVVLAYAGLHFDTGLFTVLPAGVVAFFLAHPALGWVAFVVLLAALVAKSVNGRALEQQRA